MTTREQWYVKNISNKSLSFGDLPKVPTLPPDGVVDLLMFYGKTDINLSKSLTKANLLDKIVFTKIVDGVKNRVTKANTPSAVLLLEKNPSNNVKDINNDYTVLSSDYIITCSAPSAYGSMTITLPDASTMIGQEIIFIRKDEYSEGSVTISGLVSSGTLYMSPTSTSTVYSDGTNWYLGNYYNW
jgi:hypothetical protein